MQTYTWKNGVLVPEIIMDYSPDHGFKVLLGNGKEGRHVALDRKEPAQTEMGRMTKARLVRLPSPPQFRPPDYFYRFRRPQAGDDGEEAIVLIRVEQEYPTHLKETFCVMKGKPLVVEKGSACAEFKEDAAFRHDLLVVFHHGDVMKITQGLDDPSACFALWLAPNGSLKTKLWSEYVYERSQTTASAVAMPVKRVRWGEIPTSWDGRIIQVSGFLDEPDEQHARIGVFTGELMALMRWHLIWVGMPAIGIS
jgi:hypothetical protein